MEANHNHYHGIIFFDSIAYDIAKIYIWKQITTADDKEKTRPELLMILQRYTFGSKSQHYKTSYMYPFIAYDIAKIYIWKQITTAWCLRVLFCNCL